MCSSFWDIDADSNLDSLDSRFKRQRYKIFQALEDDETFGEWQEEGHSALLYGREQGILVYIYDPPLHIILDKFFQSYQNQKNWSDSGLTAA